MRLTNIAKDITIINLNGNPKDPTPPPPTTVRAVLQGARRMLQVTIQDAGQVRRKRQQVYQDAQAVVKASSRKTKPRESNTQGRVVPGRSL